MANYKVGVDFEADGSKAINAINQVANAMQNLQNTVGTSSNKVQGSFDGMTSSVSKLTKALATYLSISAIGGVIKKSLEASASLEQAKVSFEVFTGSAETASKIMKEFKDQALKSPMQFQDIVQGGKTLMNYGITAQQVIPLTRMLGDISGGNADRFQRLSLAFGQVNATGRLMGQELRQMINAGFNPLQTISEKTGESMDSLTKRMHDGQISVREVAQAFAYATSEGGRFYGNAEKQSQTLLGAWNKLSEGTKFVLAEIGDNISKTFDLSSIATHVSLLLQTLSENFKGTNSEMQKSTFWSNALKNSLSDLALILDLAIKGIKLFGDAIEWIGTSKFMDDLSYKLDFIAIKASRLFGQNAQSNVKKFLDYINNFGEQNNGRSYNIKTELEFQKVIDPVKKFQDNFKEFFNSFNDKILGNDKLAKEEEKRLKNLEKLAKQKKEQDRVDGDYHIKRMHEIQKLREAEDSALKDADSAFESSLEKKLKKLTDNFQQTKSLYKQYGLEFKNIQTAYLIEYSQLYEAIQAKNNKILTDAMDFSISSNKDFGFEAYLEKFASDSTKFSYLVEQLTNNQSLDRIKEYTESIKSSLTDFSVGVYTGFGEIVGGLIGGISSFQDSVAMVGNMFLNLMGDLLIQIGTSAIKLGISAEAIKNALASIGIAGGAPAILAGTLAVGAGYALKAFAQKGTDAINNKNNSIQSTKSSTKSVGMTSGANYQYGGASYATQTVKLSIDLTGAITASPTGYNINKSLETVLRVTGR